MADTMERTLLAMSEAREKFRQAADRLTAFYAVPRATMAAYHDETRLLSDLEQALKLLLHYKRLPPEAWRD